MGYTHHWVFNGDAEFSDNEWATLIRTVDALVALWRGPPVRHGACRGGRSAERGVLLQFGPAVLDPCTEVVWIEGECETFFLPKKPDMVLSPGLTEERTSPGHTLLREDLSVRCGFCKTNGYAYDTLVTATLCAVLHLFPGKLARVSSDGDPEDWKEGLELARATLHKMGCPGTPNVPELDVER